MVGSRYNLLNQEKSTLDEVVASLLVQKSGTDWAAHTNELSINYAKKLGEVYGDVWYKGLLPEELFWEILLPAHGHRGPDGSIFPLDTSITKALSFYSNVDNPDVKECMALVQDLKKSIKENGFTSSLVVAVINSTLKHVDGLHRILALALLLQEGMIYKPIPVYLCDNTK